MMNDKDVNIIVIGGLNTDIIASGVKNLLGSGELTRSGTLVIGPGGKSRNMAQMMAMFLGKGRVAMIGKTSKDPYHLWKIPVTALKQAGVNTDFIKVIDFQETGKYPGIALIPVNENGENQIYCLPGINDDFDADDIDAADALFDIVGKNQGILALSLELPLSTAIHAIRKACSKNIRVVLDPGGLDIDSDYTELLKQDIYILKPNEHEAKILTGVDVKDIASAKKAADIFFKTGVQNVMITHGKNGAYVFSGTMEKHIPVPEIEIAKNTDETGCGDQATAVLCAEIVSKNNMMQACSTAVLAGTMQYNRIGIQPVLKEEINNIIKD